MSVNPGEEGEAIPPIGVCLISVNPGEEGEAAPPIGVYLTSANPGEKEGVDYNPN